MFPSGVAKPRMLCILAGMDQKHCCSGMYKAGMDGYIALHAVFFFPGRQAQDARHLGRYGPGGQFTLLWQWHVQGGYCRLRCTSRCFLVSVRRPMMFGIMSFSDQIACCSGMCKAGIAGFHALRAVFPGSQAPDV